MRGGCRAVAMVRDGIVVTDWGVDVSWQILLPSPRDYIRYQASVLIVENKP